MNKSTSIAIYSASRSSDMGQQRSIEASVVQLKTNFLAFSKLVALKSPAYSRNHLLFELKTIYFIAKPFRHSTLHTLHYTL